MTHRQAMLAVLAAAAPLLSCQPAAAGLRNASGPYQLEVLIDGVPAETWSHAGETYVLGRLGGRYELRVMQTKDRRVEVVASVDGRDVIDGDTADYRSKRGYLVPAWGSVTIDGWRRSSREVAAFRFSTVSSSYAARTGSARDVGVIGVAVFPERMRPMLPRPMRQATKDDSDASGRSDAPREESRPGSAGIEGESVDKKSAPSERSGLGTGYGEALNSPIEEVEFVRASPTRPAGVLGLRYNDADGLRAMGVDLDGGRRPWEETERRRTADPFPAERGFAPPPPGWRDERDGR